ncbi:solute carrier family 28 member 3-like [Anneissia japonica]|uniref:solute carrier family 28 member 3-like n=1 Tax=Anneissia japonica TaxID=1529436 RepID=UPI001425A1C3|nr:solute carrier family 28 member 3-like [Anneissia japonica]
MTSKASEENDRSSEYHALDVNDDKETAFTDKGPKEEMSDIQGEDDDVVKCSTLEGDIETGQVYVQSEGNAFTEAIEQIEKVLSSIWRRNRKAIVRFIYVILAVLYYTYLIFVLSKYFERSYQLLIITIVVNVLWFISIVKRRWGSNIYLAVGKKPIDYCKVNWKCCKWPVYSVQILVLVIFAGVTNVFQDIISEPDRLISAFGIIMMLAFSVICSKYPSKIKWRTVLWGIYLQFLIGLLILRTRPGYLVFDWLGKQVQTFLDYTYEGAKFVFYENLEERYFVFVVLPMIIFTSAVISVLYYYGIMQIAISAFAWIMQRTMGTSGAESFATAANVFVGMIKWRTVLWGIYLQFLIGLLILRTRPGYLVFDWLGKQVQTFLDYTYEGAKFVFYENLEERYFVFVVLPMIIFTSAVISVLYYYGIMQIAISAEESNVLEALYGGAKDGLKICGYVLANLIAIISVLAFVDAVLERLGYMAGIEDLSFQLICSYLLYPLAWLLGTEKKDCKVVAELIGTKTFLNEFIAYEHLGNFIRAGELSIRSQVIATYALCGFSNLGSLGVMLGGLVPLIPERKSEIATSCLRGLVAATIACLLTAAVAGLLYDSMAIEDGLQSAVNTTEATNTTIF